MNRRKLLRRSAVTGCLGLCAFVIASWMMGSSLMAPARHPVPLPPGEWELESAKIQSESGSEIAAWYLRAENSTATAILLHPLRGDRRSMWDRAQLLHNAGYAVVLIDLQAHGESAGEQITFGYLEKHDVQAAVDFARQKNPAHRLAILGCSLGGAAAVLASPAGIDALVLESVYPTISQAVHDRIAFRLGGLSYVLSPALLCQLPLRLGISTSDLRPIDHLSGIHCPLLLMAGDLDQHTTLAETESMFAVAEWPKQLVIFSGAVHQDLQKFNPAQYETELLTFLAAHLKPNPANR